MAEKPPWNFPKTHIPKFLLILNFTWILLEDRRWLYSCQKNLGVHTTAEANAKVSRLTISKLRKSKPRLIQNDKWKKTRNLIYPKWNERNIFLWRILLGQKFIQLQTPLESNSNFVCEYLRTILYSFLDTSKISIDFTTYVHIHIHYFHNS